MSIAPVWETIRALPSALVLDTTDLSPDAVLTRVQEAMGSAEAMGPTSG